MACMRIWLILLLLLERWARPRKLSMNTSVAANRQRTEGRLGSCSVDSSMADIAAGGTAAH